MVKSLLDWVWYSYILVKIYLFWRVLSSTFQLISFRIYLFLETVFYLIFVLCMIMVSLELFQNFSQLVRLKDKHQFPGTKYERGWGVEWTPVLVFLIDLFHEKLANVQ